VAPDGLGVHAPRSQLADRGGAVDVGPGAEAAAARLDAEQVAQHGDDEARVQVTRRMAQAARDRAEAIGPRAAEDLDPSVRRQ
jgi:hypothetical protein